MVLAPEPETICPSEPHRVSWGIDSGCLLFAGPTPGATVEAVALWVHTGSFAPAGAADGRLEAVFDKRVDHRHTGQNN
jgi:hypothetical protein